MLRQPSTAQKRWFYLIAISLLLGVMTPHVEAAFDYRFQIDTDMSILITDTPDPVDLGYEIYYDFSVYNDGPEDATNVVVTDVLPAEVSYVMGSLECEETSGTVTCNLGTITANDQVDLQITLVVNDSGTGTITNTMTVTSDLDDPDPSNNTATEFTDVLAGPPTPVQLSPADGISITNTQPTFSWSAVPGAYAYEIALDLQAEPLISYFIFSNTFTLPGPLVYATYYWQVRAISYNNVASPWSPIHSTIIEPLTNAAPVRNAYDDFDVTLTWSPVTGATAYQIQFSDNINFVDYAPIGPELPANKLWRTISFFNGTWYWRVRAKQSDGKWSAWSKTETFQVIVQSG